MGGLTNLNRDTNNQVTSNLVTNSQVTNSQVTNSQVTNSQVTSNKVTNHNMEPSMVLRITSTVHHRKGKRVKKERMKDNLFNHQCSLMDKVSLLQTLSFHLQSILRHIYTDKTAQIATSLLTSCNRLVINKPISGCVRVACDSLLTTSLLPVVNRFVAS